MTTKVGTGSESPIDGGESSARPGRILIADDHEDVLPLRILLESTGYEVHCAKSQREVLDLVAVMRFDAAILELGMPGLNGEELASRLRRHPKHAEMLLIAITAWQTRRRSEAMDAGFDYFFLKPLDFGVLEQAIGRRLGNCGRG